MKVSLWACRKRLPTDSNPATCPGFKYLLAGELPGSCGQVSLKTAGANGETTWESVCMEPMDHVGDFEMELA